MVRIPQKTFESLLTSAEYNAFQADYLSQTDTVAQALASDVTFATGKRPKFDLAYFNPSAVPANTEGYVYYDSTAKQLKLRTDTQWLNIPGVSATGYKLSPSYIIYKIGVDYYASDCDGNVDFGGASDVGAVDGANPAAVLQAAITALTTGGKILVKCDLPLGATTVSIPAIASINIVLEGETEQQQITSTAEKVIETNRTPVQTGTATNDGNVGGTTLIDTVRTEADDYWNNKFIKLTSGTYREIMIVQISDWDQATATYTLRETVGGQILTGVTYEVLNWEGGHMGPSRIGLKNFRITHTTPSAYAIGLDLPFSAVNLENIRLYNDGTRQGIGLRLGPKLGSLESFVNNVRVWDYLNCFDLALDMATYINTRAITPPTTGNGFVIRDSGAWTMLQTGMTGQAVNDLDAFHIKPVSGISGMIIGIYCEGTPTTGYVFNVDADCDVNAYGNIKIADAGWTLANSYTRMNIEFFDIIGTKYRTEARGSSTGTGIEQTIAHNLVSTPSSVAIVPTVTGATYSVWADATNIYPTVTNLKTYNWRARV